MLPIERPSFCLASEQRVFLFSASVLLAGIALQRLQYPRGTRTVKPTRTEHRRISIRTGAAVSLAILTMAFTSGCSGRSAGSLRGEYLYACALQDGVQLTTLGSDEKVFAPVTLNGQYPFFDALRWSPDGSMVLVDQRHVLRVDSLDIRQVPISGILKGWSSDGQWIWVYQADTGLVLRVRPDGADPEVVSEVAVLLPEDGPCVSPTGTRIAWLGEDPYTHDSTGLYLQDLPDGTPRSFECQGAASWELGSLGTKVFWSVDAWLGGVVRRMDIRQQVRRRFTRCRRRWKRSVRGLGAGRCQVLRHRRSLSAACTLPGSEAVASDRKSRFLITGSPKMEFQFGVLSKHRQLKYSVRGASR